MAHCPECGTEVPRDARYCEQCGAALKEAAMPPPMVGPPVLAPQFAGAGAAAAQPVTGPSLSAKQVLIALGFIGLALLFFVFYVGRTPSATTATRAPAAPAVPVVGGIGEAIAVGDTVWGVAFTDQATEFGGRTPTQGQFYIVGVISGNRSGEAFTLTDRAVGLAAGPEGTRYPAELAAWGTPDELTSGRYTTTYQLQPEQTIAGLLIFDVPADMPTPHLLVRDVANPNEEYDGAIELVEGR